MALGRKDSEPKGKAVPRGSGVVDKSTATNPGPPPNSGPFGVGAGYGPPGSDKPKGRYYPLIK